MPTPVGPAPRDPSDPDFWDFSDGVNDIDANHQDPELLAELDRRRARNRLIAVVVVAVVLAAVVITSIL